MEKRKDSMCALKLCRFCLCQDQSLSNIYDRTNISRNGIPLTLKIHSCLSMEVFASDKMPSFICSKCKFFMDLFFTYKQMCREADETILNYVQNGAEMQSMAWPAQLNKIFSEPSQINKPLLKTIVEGGTTVQVTSQNISDSDSEEDEHVFNVKLGSNDSAQIKLLKGGKSDNDDKKLSTNKNYGELYDEAGGKRWACDECYCTYPLQQLLELHKSRKHGGRIRNVACERCDAKFFTKYDLISHMHRHSDEKPFQCAECGMKFKRLVILKRHEKAMHSNIPQQPCPNCPASFLSKEELEVHLKKHTPFSKRYPCNMCDKKFADNAVLQRHLENIHGTNPRFRCEYCPERFNSATKLTKHVRTHASARAYPCRYCDKSFLKSHHYTRHLRVKHREAHRSARGPFGQSEQFRCEQCEDAFSTQDELIYHSAIHATQNLTCPLCQEKFENVDAVTAHIKSHVNGVEFMCDFCELVFTSKEKLEMHTSAAHEDELHASQDMGQDESSMDVKDDDDDDYENSINVKEEEDHMVVEIKKPNEFILSETAESAEKADNTISEDSESEVTYADFATVDPLAIPQNQAASETPEKPVKPAAVKTVKSGDNQTASILRKAEEIKRKAQQTTNEPKKTVYKEKSNSKVETTDKSLRLLEKELQELKRTNTRNDTAKAPVKAAETAGRNRRQAIPTSTPKRLVEVKKDVTSKSPVVEKKLPERRVVTKENKEPKETKEVKTNNSTREEREVKEKDTPKTVVKNGNADKSSADESVRRSTRPSKVRDYAKMIRDKSENSDEDDDSDSDDEYESNESRLPPKPRRSSLKSAAKPSPAPPAPSAPAATPAPRKRGRPRKDLKEVPNKIRKEDDNTAEEKSVKPDLDDTNSKEVSKEKDNVNQKDPEESADANKTETEPKPPSGVLVSPTGQTLKKVPIRALPPGIKPLPLPARTLGAGELCEMQIGKKMVKVQKIVMTKAEVEAMAKKGLVEMKDGTMVLKQGIKLPTSDAHALKSTLASLGDKEQKLSSVTSKPQTAVEDNS